MNESHDEKLQELLRNAIPPVKDSGPRRDLWPRMLQKLTEQPIRVSWVDWILIGLAALWLVIFPQVIPALLYQF